jgi:transposase
VQDLARRYGLCPSLIYRWRRAAAQRGDLPASRREAVSPAQPAPEFVPIGVFGRAPDEGPALVAGPRHAAASWAASGRAVAPSAMDERPGLIEIDLADGTRLRVDAFVNERALRRVLAVLRASA